MGQLDNAQEGSLSSFVNILYLSYDGMTDPLGRSQVLPYLVGLSERGHRFTIVSFEKRENFEVAQQAVRQICVQAGIEWHPLRYHKHPPILSSILDIYMMRRRAVSLHRSRHFELVHCRSYIAAVTGRWLKRQLGLPFLFDMRGFWIDERVEMGLWPLKNPFYAVVHRSFRKWEREFFQDADAIVSLTNRARQEIQSWPNGKVFASRTTVIPCCVDLAHFASAGGELRARSRKALGLLPNTRVLIYLGSLGARNLLDEMLDLFGQYRGIHRGARFLFVTHHPAEMILSSAAARGIRPDELIIRSALREEIPSLIAASDLGVSFYRASYAAVGCSPTKLGEMLAMGVPVIANGGIGDVAEIITASGAGVVIESFERKALARAIRKVENLARSREEVRAAASRWFALADGVDRYDSIYRSLEGRPL